jgi:phosphoribosylaminoimidazole-succinocarboxamide synthase
VLFDFGTKNAAKRGLILVDTKYEFGIAKGQKVEVLLADEIHTQDSSRYWIADSYQQSFDAGQDPQMLDKEFVRRWLIERGYMGDGTPPPFEDEFRIDVALRYIDACERITGLPFQPLTGPQEERIKAVLTELR